MLNQTFFVNFQSFKLTITPSIANVSLVVDIPNLDTHEFFFNEKQSISFFLNDIKNYVIFVTLVSTKPFYLNKVNKSFRSNIKTLWNFVILSQKLCLKKILKYLKQ